MTTSVHRFEVAAASAHSIEVPATWPTCGFAWSTITKNCLDSSGKPFKDGDRGQKINER